MVDHALLSRVLSEFVQTLVRRYDVGEVLYQLTDRTVEVLGVAGSGVSLQREGGKLLFVSATDEATAKVERVQEDAQKGPCHEAHQRGEPVLIPDIAADDRWPSYRPTAAEQGFHAVAGIPMRLQDIRLGALNVYDDQVRSWDDDVVAAAVALANVATSLVINARELEQSRRVAEQLRHALDSRVVIEQAKGVIARDREVSVEDAFGVLRSRARDNNLKLHDAARAVVDGLLRP